MPNENDINYLVALRDLVKLAAKRADEKDREISSEPLDEFTLGQVKSVLDQLSEESDQIDSYVDVLLDDPVEHEEYFDLIIKEVAAYRDAADLNQLEQDIQSQIDQVENRISLDEFILNMEDFEEDIDLDYSQALRYLADIANDPDKDIDLQTLDYLEKYRDRLVADIDMKSDLPLTQIVAIQIYGEKEDLIVFMDSIAQKMNYDGEDALSQLIEDLDKAIAAEMKNYTAEELEEKAIKQWMKSSEGTPLPDFGAEENVNTSEHSIVPEIETAFDSLESASNSADEENLITPEIQDTESSYDDVIEFNTADREELAKALAEELSEQESITESDKIEKEPEPEPKQAQQPEASTPQISETTEQLQREIKDYERQRDLAIDRIAKGIWRSKDKQRSIDAIRARVQNDAIQPRSEASGLKELQGKKVLNGKKDNQRIYGKALDYQKCINETKAKLEQVQKLESSNAPRSSTKR